MATTYGPPGETPSALWLEKSNLIGAILGGVAYGVHAAIFAECVLAVWHSSSFKSGVNGRSATLLVFVSVLFAMGTLNIACTAKLTELMYIDNRAFPGGPDAWISEFYSVGVNTAGNASYIVANFFADGLLLWRTYVVWDSLWIIVFPFILYLASTAMSILTLFQSSRPDASLWTSVTIQVSLPYFSISISLNIILTLLLISRLWYMSYKTRRTLGEEHGTIYLSLASMLAESAAPYAITGLIFIITYARQSNVQNLVLPVLSQIMCISPTVIILRVATGRAVVTGASGSGPSLAPMKFNPAPRARVTKETMTFGLGSIVPDGRTSSGLIGSTLLGPGSRPDLFKEEAEEA